MSVLKNVLKPGIHALKLKYNLDGRELADLVTKTMLELLSGFSE
jgi:hypothetical protein